MRHLSILATLLLAVTALTVTPGPADAAVTSASIVGGTATLNLDGADDNVTVSVSGGLLVHGQTTGGLNSGADWDSAAAGDQTVAANGIVVVVLNGGDGNDSLAVVAKDTEIATAAINGGPGDDVLIGSDTGDSLVSLDGNDRLVGGKGGDDMNGGAGNDTLVWNNGDGSDFIDGDAGNDTTEVNGNATLGDVFTIEPDAGRVRFRRTNLVGFVLEASAERFQVNGLGGDDSVTATPGTALAALTLLSVDGGAGADTVNGSDGPDLLLGGDGVDTLNGGGGDDRIVGDRANDTMDGGPGDDTLVWNNGDATDVVNGDGGRDDVEVNGSPVAGDVLDVQSNGTRIELDRTNLVPFSLDIGSSETMHANGLGGDDGISVGHVGSFSVTPSGGPGNDTLTGDGSSETFLGGSGNDTINPGGGLDVVFADDGDDTVNVRDLTADLATGGTGNDSAVADGDNVDVLDGFESVDRTPDGPPPVVPPIDTSTPPVGIRSRTVTVRSGIAAIRVHCPSTATAGCLGSLTVRTATPVSLAGLSAVVALGSRRYEIAPATTSTVTTRLTKGSKRLADGLGHLAVRVIALTGEPGKLARSSRRIELVFRTASTRS
jgi:Ca2+-binding RTX toxin-like protein